MTGASRCRARVGIEKHKSAKKKLSAYAWARHCMDPSSLEQGVPKRRGRGKFVMCAPIGHMAIAEN